MKDTPRDPKFCSPEFWQRRLREDNNFEQAVQKIDWNVVNFNQKEILNNICFGKVFDAGCGFGRICQLLGDQVTDYVRMDITPEFIAEAQKRFPDKKFILGDIRDTGFNDKVFDWGIAIGMADSIYWPEMEKELKRICKRIIILWCEKPKEYKII